MCGIYFSILTLSYVLVLFSFCPYFHISFMCILYNCISANCLRSAFSIGRGRSKSLPKISSKLSEQPLPETIMGATGPAPTATARPAGRSSKETAHTPLCHHVCRAGVFCQIVMRHTQSPVQSGQCDISWLMTSKGRLDLTSDMLCL